MSHLEIFSQQMIPAVEREMKSVLGLDDWGDSLFYGMMHYHLGWVDAQLQRTGSNGGKHIRPVLCLLVCASAGGDWQQAVPAGAAIELIHNFTLIHDDIQDASPTRRGRSTVWQLWGVPQAINSGDSMFAAAHLALHRLISRGVRPEIVSQAFYHLSLTCLKLTYGQYQDMSFESRPAVAVEEYIEMITGKTAVLISLCAQLGALIADHDRETTEHYASFGRDLGLAFQVKDDILGIWGDEAVIGKSAATDIATRKKSLPVLYGLATSPELRQLYARPENDPDFVPQVIHWLNHYQARQFAESYANHYSQSALDHLAAARPGGAPAEALQKLTNTLLNRQA